MAEHPLSLKNLTRFDFSREKMAAFNAAWAAREQAYKDKYGDKWQEQMDADYERDRCIRWRRWVNGRIYTIGQLRIFPTDRFSPEKEAYFEQRLHEVYGDQYDALISHRIRKDPRVAELLIQDAIRTGEWELLPDELHPAYHERVDKMP